MSACELLLVDMGTTIYATLRPFMIGLDKRESSADRTAPDEWYRSSRQVVWALESRFVGRFRKKRTKFHSIRCNPFQWVLSGDRIAAKIRGLRRVFRSQRRSWYIVCRHAFTARNTGPRTNEIRIRAASGPRWAQKSEWWNFTCHGGPGAK